MGPCRAAGLPGRAPGVWAERGASVLVCPRLSPVACPPRGCSGVWGLRPSLVLTCPRTRLSREGSVWSHRPGIRVSPRRHSTPLSQK